MHTLFLAGTLTVYVGGMVMFVTDPKENGHLTLVLLKGDTALHHLKPVASHQPYLVVKAEDTCLAERQSGCASVSAGGKAIGGAGGQIVRFPISGAVDLKGGADRTIPLTWSAKTVLFPADLDKDNKLKSQDDLLSQWPTAGTVELRGVISVEGAGRTGTLTFEGKTCPGAALINDVWTKVVTNVAERFVVKIDLAKAPTFDWKNHDAQAILSGSKDSENPEVSIWNLPEDASHHAGMGGYSEAVNHFTAYYSLLKDKCACELKSVDVTRGTEPAFCPPSEGAP